MMKSFFKKLAFVMALAMVVSAMAPAATAKAAEAKTVSICVQNDNYIERPTYELTEGDAAKDFCFAGAPDWKNYKWTWSSDNEAVATVDNTGLVTPVAAGEATITVKGGDVYTGTMKLTVKSKEVAKTFEVEQKTANKAVLTFADATAVTTDITVVKVISTLAGDKYQPWVLDASKTKAEGNTVAIEPWVAFGTATYLVTANGVTQELKTAVGDPAKATIEYKEPYTFAEAKKAAAVTLKVTDDNDVEVTNYSVYYELVSATPTGYAYVNASSGDLYFYVDNAKAKVRATIRYTVNGQNKSFAVEEEFSSQKMPVVTINNYLETAAVVTTKSLEATAEKTAEQMKDAIDWTSTKVKIGDNTAQVVGLIKNSAGKSFSINTYSKGTTNDNKTLLNADANGNEITVNPPYKFTYESTDSSKVIVDETTGTLIGVNVTESPVYILVKMATKRSNNTYADPVIVAAVPVDVQAKKAPLYTTLGADNMAVLLTAGAHTTKEVTPKTYNQYEEQDTNDYIISATTTFNNKTYTAPFKAGTNKTVVIDGAEVNRFFNANATAPNNYFVFNIKMNSGKTVDFYLTLKEVTTDNINSMEYKLATTSATIKADKLAEKVSVSVTSMVLGEKYGTAPFYYGKMDASVAASLPELTDLVGALYVVVTDPSGDVITPATSSAVVAGNKWEADALATKTGKLATLETGDYKVVLYRVIDVIEDTVNNKIIIVDTPIDEATYAVKNELPSTYTDLKFDLTKKATVVGDTIKLATGAVTFKINGTAVDASASNVTVSGASVPGSNVVFVYSVKVQHVVGNGYVEVEIPVNQIFNR